MMTANGEDIFNAETLRRKDADERKGIFVLRILRWSLSPSEGENSSNNARAGSLRLRASALKS